MKNNRIKGIAKSFFCVGLALILIFQLIPDMQRNVGAAGGEFKIIPGDFNFSGGATSGYNHFHIEGNEATKPPNSFWQNTFCIEKDHSAAPGNAYTYYYNTAVVGDPSFTTFVSTVLSVNGVDMTETEWARFRNCIVYVNVNRDARGQYVLWSGLGHFLPTKYSRAGSFGDTWQDVWLTKYFGAAASADFMGLGPITAGQTVSIDAAVNVEIVYPAGFDPTGATETTGRIGPFKLQWAAGSDPVLAQLNCGPNKITPPLFNLGASNSSVRFYKNSSTSTPTSSVRLGDEFYIEWNANAKTGGLTNIAASCIPELTTKVVADQFFLNPVAQNQANVETETGRPDFNFNVRTPIYTGPTTPSEIEDYVRPTIEKQVALDNHVDNTGSFSDILEVYPGTDVFHRMTVTSNDPKGTVLTFQNTDYDLYPSVLQNHAVDWSSNVPSDTALVHNADELRAAIGANKNIKLMADITLPSNWAPPVTVYSGIFDGNNYKLKGDGGTMTQPVIKETLNAVFYRVQFVDFTMARNENNGTLDNFGSLVDVFEGSQSKMLDCYIKGTLTVDVSGSAAERLITAGGVAGRANGEIYGVQALLDLTIDCGANNYFDYAGGMFGQLRVSVFENNELLSGSVVTNSNQVFGGISGSIWSSVDDLKVLNCKADYTYYNAAHYQQTRERRFGGMFYFTTSLVTLVDRCIVNCEYRNFTGPNYGYVNVFSGLIGEYYNSASKQMARTISNCSVNFSGDTVILESNDSITQRGQLGSGAGIVNLGCDGEWALNTFIVESCYANINLSVRNNAGAGIFNDVRKTVGDPYSNPEAYTLRISNCTVEGQIIGTGDSIIAGIATDSSVSRTAADKSIGLQSGSIQNCVVTAQLRADTGRIGGIWATRVHNTYRSVPLTSHSGPMLIENCLFDGDIDDGSGGAVAHDIFACYEGSHTCATALNNYTSYNLSASDNASPDGEYIAPSNAYDGRTMIAPAARSPVQRIYVSDYYHQSNAQEFVENLYVWEGGTFKHIWESAHLSTFYSSSGDYNISGDSASHYVDIKMTPGTNTFTFYYFVGNPATQSKSGGPDGPWNGINGLPDQGSGYLAWQNTVKITPRDNKLVNDGTGKKFDWPGAFDDDWVLCIDNEPLTGLSIIKVTNSSGFPVPLEGCTFTLYRTNDTFGSPSQVATLSPSGFTGVNSPPTLTAGKYTLVETIAPANYTSNANRIWYLVFSNGVLEMYSNPSLTPMSKIELGETIGNNAVTYTAILENTRDSSPLAKISLIKYDEDDNPLVGAITSNGMHFTGAIYGLFKFEGDNFTGYSHNYGNTLAYGGGQQDWCLIEPGYYEMVEIKAPDGFALNPTPIYISFNGVELIINGNKSSSNQSPIYSQGTADKVYVTVQDWQTSSANPVSEATIKAIDSKTAPSTPPPSTPGTSTSTPTPTPTDTPTTSPDTPTPTPSGAPDEPDITPAQTPEPTSLPRLPTPATPAVPWGSTLVDNGDGTFTEFDEDGIPLGTWVQQDGEWIFIPLIVPDSGDNTDIIGPICTMIISLGAIIGLLHGKKRRGNI